MVISYAVQQVVALRNTLKDGRGQFTDHFLEDEPVEFIDGDGNGGHRADEQ